MLPKTLTIQSERLDTLMKHIKSLKDKFSSKTQEYIDSSAKIESAGSVSDKSKITQAQLLEELDIIGAYIKGLFLSIKEETDRCIKDVDTVVSTMLLLNNAHQRGETLNSLTNKIPGGKSVYSSYMEKTKDEEKSPETNILAFVKKKPGDLN